VIAVLDLFKASDKGRIAQVGTGEGKTEIIAIFASIKVLQGRKVDISTSSDALATRDPDKLKEFYEVLGIKVSHNIGDHERGPKNCYSAHIVYREPLYFIGDILFDISNDIKGGRGLDVLIVDEMDNMLLDQTNLKVRLSGAVPGFEHLKQMLIYSYGHFQRLVEFSSGDNGNTYVYIPNSNQTDTELKFETIKVNQSYTGFLQSEFSTYVTEILDLDTRKPERKIAIPSHLDEFLPKHIGSWADSVTSSLFYVQDKHYRVCESKKREVGNATEEAHRLVIAPIDYENTGQIQEGIQWNNGLHQFLQLKHDLPLTSEGLVDVFMSYVGYVLKYSNLYGLTATIGTNAHKELLKEVYGLGGVVIPSFIQKKLYIYPETIDLFRNYTKV
jgi:preprotein translocase subunit SecA